MATGDLVDIARASQLGALAALASSGGSGIAYLQSLISAASDAVKNHCHRDFVQTSYVEYMSGGNYTGAAFLLRQYPVIEITRLACDPESVLLVQNTDAVTNQRATVETTSDATGNTNALKLVRVASGVIDPQTLTVSSSSNVTLSALATSINALGNGWSATVQGGYGPYPAADLRPLQGAFSALSGGQMLEMHLETVQPWMSWYDPLGGPFVQTGWRLDKNTGELFGMFPRGSMNIRVDYTAGFATIPQAVQEATVALIQWFYNQSQTNQAIKEMKVGPSAYTLNDSREWPAQIKSMLSYYVAHDRVIAYG